MLLSCAFTEPVKPGPGRTSREAKQRQDELQRRGLVDAARRAGETADARPTDLRMQRKAVALADQALHSGVAEPAEVLGWVGGGLERLEAGCETRTEAADLLLRASAYERAAAAYARSARQCGDVDAALAAVRPLRQLGRCDEAVELMRDAWARCPGDKQVALLDRVHQCSTPLNFLENSAFVPMHVLDAYLNLLARRERERIAADRAYERQRRAQEADAAAQQARWGCESDCNQAGAQCRTSCGANTSCPPRCDALVSTCRAQCH